MRCNFLLLFALFMLSASAQPALNKTDSCLVTVYSSNFNNTNILLNQNPFINSYIYYWKALIYPTPNNYLLISQNIADSALKTNNNITQQLLLQLVRMRIFITNKNYIKALACADIIGQLYSTPGFMPDNLVNQLLWGLYNIYAGLARQQGFFYSCMLNNWPKSNIDYGLKQLEDLSNNKSIFISTESHYFLYKYYAFTNNYEKANYHITYLCRVFPNNKIYHELFTQINQLVVFE